MIIVKYSYPDEKGKYGVFGGRYVPETLMQPLLDLEQSYKRISADTEFSSELKSLLREYAGRPTPLYEAKRLSEHAGGARIFFKREDLCHTGSHKINNTLGQALLAKRMGKSRLIAETGAGQHGVATATAAALLGLECRIFMGEEDVRRQALNAYRMKLLGADVREVFSGSRTLKDAVNEAFRDWVSTAETTHYCLGSVMGPHPFPKMVRDFQSVIGREADAQFTEREGGTPDYLIACVGGGSNSMGLFHPFLGRGAEMIGVEAGGSGNEEEKHCRTLSLGSVGVLHGSKSYVLQNEEGQISKTSSVSAGLDYPGVGCEHSHFMNCGMARYESATDAEALEAASLLSRKEGIIPALESAHAVAYAVRLASSLSKEKTVLVCLSGRGDKDVETMMKEMPGGVAAVGQNKSKI